MNNAVAADLKTAKEKEKLVNIAYALFKKMNPEQRAKITKKHPAISSSLQERLERL